MMRVRFWKRAEMFPGTLWVPQVLIMNHIMSLENGSHTSCQKQFVSLYGVSAKAMRAVSVDEPV